MIRVGIGYDSHRFAEGRLLVLAGVTIPFARGLTGHSDADVATHACIDALLGAVGMGDIGSHFPDTDPEYSGADSIALMAEVHRRIRSTGWTANQVDVTVILELPRLGPHLDAMRERLAGPLGIAPADVSVKATTNEGMGFIGRGEGVAAMAVATLRRLEAAPPLQSRPGDSLQQA